MAWVICIRGVVYHTAEWYGGESILSVYLYIYIPSYQAKRRLVRCDAPFKLSMLQHIANYLCKKNKNIKLHDIENRQSSNETSFIVNPSCSSRKKKCGKTLIREWWKYRKFAGGLEYLFFFSDDAAVLIFIFMIEHANKIKVNGDEVKCAHTFTRK